MEINRVFSSLENNLETTGSAVKVGKEGQEKESYSYETQYMPNLSGTTQSTQSSNS